MNPTMKALIRHFLGGVMAAAVANVSWLVVTGATPSLLAALIASDVAAGVYLIVQYARFRRKWQSVLASFQRPALGEGTDIPHRPPADEPDGGRG